MGKNMEPFGVKNERRQGGRKWKEEDRKRGKEVVRKVICNIIGSNPEGWKLKEFKLRSN